MSSVVGDIGLYQPNGQSILVIAYKPSSPSYKRAPWPDTFSLICRQTKFEHLYLGKVAPYESVLVGSLVYIFLIP